MQSTINVGKIAGGRNTNVVPSQCTAQIDRRLLPSETVDQAFAELLQVVAEAGEPQGTVDVVRLLGTNGFHCGTKAPLIAALIAAIEQVSGEPAGFSSGIGVSDGRHVADRGIEIVNFGPGVGSEGHASNESVALDSLRTSALVLDRMFAALVGYSN
jgi:acetylornithine deacetylase/succinyl-diaminopimelate desuccinylase-like protein